MDKKWLYSTRSFTYILKHSCNKMMKKFTLRQKNNDYDLFKDVQVIHYILGLGQEQKINKVLKMPTIARFLR